MYARVLRKWSLKTQLQMSLLVWLIVVTMLLLCLCAPPATCADARSRRSTTSGAPQPQWPSQPRLQSPQPPLPPATIAYTHAADWRRQRPPNAGATIAESHFIPVDGAADSSRSAATHIYASRLFSRPSGGGSGSGWSGSSSGSSSSDSSSSSSSKLFSSSRLSSVSEKQQQQLEESAAAAAAAYADGLAYAHYRRAAEQQQQLPAAQTTTTSPTAPTPAVLKPHFDDVVEEVEDEEEEEEEDEEEDDADAGDDEPLLEDIEDDVADADVDDGDEDDVDVVAHNGPASGQQQRDFSNAVAATAKWPLRLAATLSATQKVPNIKNSHIINLFHNYNYNNNNNYNNDKQQQQQQHQQQQQQQLAETEIQQKLQLTAAVSSARSIKSRRHISEQQQPQLQQQQQQQQHQRLRQHQPQQQPPQQQTLPAISAILAPTSTSAAQSYHSPVRQNVAVAAKWPTTKLVQFANGKNLTLKLLPPIHYRIEAFEIPSTLPYRGALTEQQRRMLLHQQRLLLQQQQQQQAARSRRDSRNFALAGQGALAPDAGGGNVRYFNMQPQQQQQQFQRLQQQPANNNLNNNNMNMFARQQSQPQPQHQQHHHQHQQHQHQHHQHQQRQHRQHQQRPRKHARRYCSARDPEQLAFEAPTVFEGKITSMSRDRRHNFSATVQVGAIYKRQIGYLLQQLVRLQFTYINSSGECDIYREQLRPRGLVRGDGLEQQRTYLFFVQQLDSRNFTILGQPIRKTRRVVEAVKHAVSENYAQLASIRSIAAINRTMELGKMLRIVCKVQGSPPPKVTWFKDEKSINRNRKLYQFLHYKKRSELIIRSFNLSDAGRYECRAKNKVKRTLERRTIMIKADPVPRFESSLTGGTGNNCPDDASEFCFNGGTCKFFSEISSYSCICPDGFIGERCDRKEVNNIPPSTTYKVGYIADDPNSYAEQLQSKNHTGKTLQTRLRRSRQIV